MAAQAPPRRSRGKRHHAGRKPESDLKAMILVRKKGKEKKKNKREVEGKKLANCISILPTLSVTIFVA